MVAGAMSVGLDFLDELPDGPIGLAVSGGSDSMALLHILTDWQSATKPKLSVASIDHGLRSGSKSEVEFVKKVCEEKKVKHFSLAPATQLLEST